MQRLFLIAFVIGLACLLFSGPATTMASDMEGPIYRYDITHLYDLDLQDPAQAREAWETVHFVASLQGIVNRSAPRLFLRFMAETDDFWFDHLRSPGEWLGDRRVVEIESLEELLDEVGGAARGLVVYNEEVRASSNIASTIAGVEDRLCLRYDPSPDSLYSRVLNLKTDWDIKRLFREDGSSWGGGRVGEPIAGTNPPVSSTGSAKGDAYLWAKQRYLDAGRTSDEFLAYYIDSYWLENPTLASLENFTLSNHDFFISQRAFFFDLGVWGDEAPVDDPDQPVGTDRRILEEILEKTAERADGGILHIGGFTPWMWKYTVEAPGNSRHGAVATEWEKNKLASVYNGVIDSDALGLSGMANASFYQHHPLRERYAQPPRPTLETLREAGYIEEDGGVAPYVYLMFYQGDYDSAAWLNRHVPKWWADPARGTIPLNWAFNPNLDRRAPHAMHYARTRQADDEWFIAGDSGAGYLNPGMLFAENRGPGYSDGWEAWADYCQRYFEKYGLSITGFVIDGASPGMGREGMDHYLKFSPDGFIGQKIPAQGVHRETMPFIRMGADFHQVPVADAAERIVAAAGGLVGPRFMPLRTILKSPSWHKEVMEAVAASPGGERVRFLDAYSFMLLLKTFEQSKRDRPVASGPFSDAVEVIFEAPDGEEGLHLAKVDDGPFEIAEVDGRGAVRQRAADGVRYLYFRVGDGFGRSVQWGEGIELLVTVRVLDTAEGAIGLQYDSPEDSYRAAGGPVRLAGTSRWREISFPLKQARFDHGQNGASSFRLVNFGGELVVDRVTVRRVE